MKIWQKKVIEFLATGFYAGLLPKAPGTFGTLVAFPLVFLFDAAGPLRYMVLTFASVLLAIVVSEIYQALKGTEHDRQEIVIDEIIGLLITMTWVPLNLRSCVAGFLLFRLFDIWKPWPIRALDAQVKGGLGVVVDDVAAGLIANLILQVVITKTEWLGVI